jgi:SUMO ligase MMS21 Smc5/6 complex component
MRKRPYRKPVVPVSNWTTEQDCYLIEHSLLGIEELQQVLPYTEDEIQERKEILGLIRRSKQLKKWI